MSFSAEPKADQGVDLWTQVTVGGVKYLRLPLRTGGCTRLTIWCWR